MGNDVFSFFASIIVCFVIFLPGTTFNALMKGRSLKHVLGCRITESDDFPGFYVLCTSYKANHTSYFLPAMTRRLRIYKVSNLLPDEPLAPQLGMLKTLEIDFCSITRVSRRMFEGLHNLTQISIRSTSITELPHDVFLNNPYLEIVDLSRNFLVSIASFTGSLSSLKYLKILYLEKNMLIRWIDETDFLPLMNSSLEALDLSSCIITVIEKAAFKPLTSLSSLNVSANPMNETAFINMSYSLHLESLKEFRAEDMKNMSYFSASFLNWMRGSNIEKLYLSRNRLISFPAGNYPKLKVLELIRCNVDLRDYGFTGMPSLEYLTVKEHEVPFISTQFSTNKKLKFLDLSNYIALTSYSSFEIKDYAFKNQKNLEVLYLSYLPIRQKIRRHTFSGLINLRNLMLNSGFIELIEERAFEDLNNLRNLDISYNKISSLSNETFFGLKSVKNIDLRRNAISFLNDIYPFLQTPSLEVLTLNSNKIISIPSHIFLNLSYISVIQASDNLIQPWEKEILPKPSTIFALVLNKNRITHFTRQMFNDVKQLEFFDFSENPINCSSCSTVELQTWMNETNISISRLSIADTYACKEPSSLEGVYILDANLSSVLTHCLPVEYDIAKVLYCTFVPLFMLGFIAAFVWYQWKWNIRYFIFLARSRAKKYKAQVTADRYAFDAFISYCEKDLPWIRKELVPNIEGGETTIRLCLPDRNFDAAHSTMDNVAAAIEHSRTTVLVLSNEYMDSNWCRFDMEMAQHKLFEDTRSGLILILLEAIHKSKMTKNLQYVIRTRTCIAWTNNLTGQKLFWERLRAAIMKPEDKGISTHIT